MPICLTPLGFGPSQYDVLAKIPCVYTCSGAYVFQPSQPNLNPFTPSFEFLLSSEARNMSCFYIRGDLSPDNHFLASESDEMCPCDRCDPGPRWQLSCEVPDHPSIIVR